MQEDSASDKENQGQILLQPSDYEDHFDSNAYLEFYYSQKATTDGKKFSDTLRLTITAEFYTVAR